MATKSEPLSFVKPVSVHCAGTVDATSEERTWTDFVGANVAPPHLHEPNALQRAALAVLHDTPQTGKTTAVVVNCTQKIHKWLRAGADIRPASSPLVLYVVTSETRIATIQDRFNSIYPASHLKVLSLQGAPATYYPALNGTIDVLVSTLEKTSHLLNAMQFRAENVQQIIFDLTEDFSAVSHTVEPVHRHPSAHASIMCVIKLGRTAVSRIRRHHFVRYRPVAAGPIKDKSSDEASSECCIIGPGGKLLAKLHQETQCTITISSPAWDGSQLVRFHGTTEAISFAIGRCDRVFLQKGVKLRRKFAFPHSLCHTIRGPYNSHLKHIQKKFGVYADLKEEEHSEYTGLCTLELTGFPLAIDTAAAYLKTLTMKNANSFYEERVDQVQVPTATKFHVLGDQGLTLKGLQAHFNVFLTFQHAKKTPTEVPLAIRGLARNIEDAKVAILSIIRQPAEATKYAIQTISCATSWPATKTRVAPIDSGSFDPSAYAPPRKFYVVTHTIRNAKYGRCNHEYQPVVRDLRIFEQPFDNITTADGLVNVQSRIDIAERDIAKATIAGDTDQLPSLHAALLEYCTCLMAYLTEETEARELPSEDEVMWVRDLPANFGHAEIQELFQHPLYDVILHRKNAGDLAAAPSCLVVFRDAAHARAPNKCAERGLRLEKTPSFKLFYRAYARRVLALRAILDGATIASQSFRHPIYSVRRRQLAVDNKDQLEANQALQSPVFEYTETIPADTVSSQEEAEAWSSTSVRMTSSAAADEPNRPTAFASQNRGARKERVVPVVKIEPVFEKQ